MRRLNLGVMLAAGILFTPISRLIVDRLKGSNAQQRQPSSQKASRELPSPGHHRNIAASFVTNNITAPPMSLKPAD